MSKTGGQAMVISSQNEMMKIDSSLLDIMMDKTILVLYLGTNQAYTYVLTAYVGTLYFNMNRWFQPTIKILLGSMYVDEVSQRIDVSQSVEQTQMKRYTDNLYWMHFLKDDLIYSLFWNESHHQCSIWIG